MLALMMSVLAIAMTGTLCYILRRNKILMMDQKCRESLMDIALYLGKRKETLERMMAMLDMANEESEEIIEDFDSVESGESSQLMTMQAISSYAGQRKMDSLEMYRMMMKTCEDLDDHVMASKRLYNANVSAYNTALNGFLGSFIANQYGLTIRKHYQSF